VIKTGAECEKHKPRHLVRGEGGNAITWGREEKKPSSLVGRMADQQGSFNGKRKIGRILPLQLGLRAGEVPFITRKAIPNKAERGSNQNSLSGEGGSCPGGGGGYTGDFLIGQK